MSRQPSDEKTKNRVRGIFWIAITAALFVGCRATTPAHPILPTSNQTVPAPTPPPQLQLPVISRPTSLQELLDQLRDNYKAIRNQLRAGRLEGVPKTALTMVAYARLVQTFVAGLPPEEQARVTSLAQTVEKHALELHRASTARDLDRSRRHLNHVLWFSYQALQGGLRKALQQEREITE